MFGSKLFTPASICDRRTGVLGCLEGSFIDTGTSTENHCDWLMLFLVVQKLRKICLKPKKRAAFLKHNIYILRENTQNCLYCQHSDVLQMAAHSAV